MIKKVIITKYSGFKNFWIEKTSAYTPEDK